MIGTLRVLSWALHARWATETQVRRTGLRDLRVPPAPRVGRQHEALVARVLGITRATCLVRVLVLQKFLLYQGIEVEVVVGATSPRDGFSAHAWLADDQPDHRGHIELLRLDAHGVRRL